MNREYFGKIFSGPYKEPGEIINTGGVYIITPFIQTGAVQILDVGQDANLAAALNAPSRQSNWETLARNFGGFNFYVHYEIIEFNRLTLVHQIREAYHLPVRDLSKN